jgi:mannose/fructose/N-acetylgalactosamine-specific phosphotransferase system component IIC
LLEKRGATKLSPTRDGTVGTGFAEAVVETMIRRGITSTATSAIAVPFSILRRVLAMVARCATVLFM